MITLALFVSLLLAATRRYSGKYVHLVSNNFNYNFTIKWEISCAIWSSRATVDVSFFKNFLGAVVIVLSGEGASRHPQLLTARHVLSSFAFRHGLQYLQRSWPTSFNNWLTWFIIVKSKESKVPNLILFSFEMPRRVERIWRLLLQGYG